jgi:single-stranded-DNA-specific exonuclease
MAIFHPDPTPPTSTRASLTGTRWLVAPPGDVRTEGVPPAIGHVLASRGIVTAAQVDAFLHATLESMADPMLLPDMAAAVEAVLEVLARGGRIRVFGDYDADGITSTALLVRALGALGGQLDWYLPHRIDDGYGLNTRALDAARADGVDLGITVDNGITAHAQLEHARAIGLRMIVTDHHEPDGGMPPAVAVINPKRADSAYPYRELAGVGVAYGLLRAVCRAKSIPEAAVAKFLDLVTIGTIADVAPLTGENRVLVRHGLPQLTPQSKKIGLASLLRAIGVAECAGCGDVGFQIGPRLNAAGRVAHASDALRLLLTADRAEADALAARLCAHNTQRQDEEARTLEQALALAEARDLAQEKVLVLASPDWHPGVIGIVASRLVERYHRPAALIAVQNGIGKGSARARAPFHLWEALSRSQQWLTRFGGHRVAAGFEVPEGNIDGLRAALLAEGDAALTEDDMRPSLEVDAWVSLHEMTTAFAREVEALAPFGMGNPTPIFAAADVEVVQVVRRGQDGVHVSLTLRDDASARPIGGIWFRHGSLADRIRPGACVDIAFTVGLNTWQGVTSPQMVVKDVRG